MKLRTPIELICEGGALIRLEAIEVFEDGSGACGILIVHSGNFSCTGHLVSFDNLAAFVRSVQRLYKDLKGKARLSHAYEHDFIERRNK